MTVCHSNTVDPHLSSVPEGISSSGSHEHVDDAGGIVYALDDTEGEFGHRDHGARMKNEGTTRNRREVDALRRGNMGRSRLCWICMVLQ